MNKGLINITSSAINQLSKILKKTNNKAILFDLKSGGCNGFEYRFTPIDKISNPKNVYTKDGSDIEICDHSLFHVLGTKIDWQEDIMGKTFKFDNPLAANHCGCGSSFNPK